ncbi:hypothetical protein E2C01_073542 [Portunus trituberculatus]|uniref:Uncharacterized protein n=1 Tax=Portunus trituberculatus TaxID=210409 RepID=A0A5B7I0X9_PORTR|nr:hypothetical protein [Portunus trituberculatus]
MRLVVLFWRERKVGRQAGSGVGKNLLNCASQENVVWEKLIKYRKKGRDEEEEGKEEKEWEEEERGFSRGMQEAGAPGRLSRHQPP